MSPGCTSGKPVVSAVVPNYNDAATLSEALDALLGQSYTQLEVIVIDDASTDDSLDVLESYARRDSRLRVLRHERNRGPIIAQRAGFALSTGAYIFGPSANDKVLPGFLENLVDVLERHQQAAIALCDLVNLDNPFHNESPALSDRPSFLAPDEVVAALRRRVFMLSGAATLVRRSAWEKAGWLLPELRWMADFLAMHVVAFRHGLCYVPGPLYGVRMPGYSLSGPRSRAQREVNQALLRHLQSDEYKDVRICFAQSGVLASIPFLAQAMLGESHYWDLITPLLVGRWIKNAVKDAIRPMTPVPVRAAYRRMRTGSTPRTAMPPKGN